MFSDLPSPTRLAAGLTAALAACLTIPHARAVAAYKFDQSVLVAAGQDGNVAVVGGDNLADQTAGVSVDLLLEMKSRRSQWTLNYAPSFQAFNEYSDLDNLSHFLTFGFDRETSRDTTLTVSSTAELTERQGITFDTAGEPDSYLPRTQQTRFDLALGMQFQVTEQANVGWGARVETRNIEDLPNFNFEDSDVYELTAGYGHELGDRLELGVRYQGAQNEFETSPSTLTNSLELFAKHQLTRSLELEWSAGGELISLDEPGAENQLRSTYEIALRSNSRRGSLQVGARQSVGAGVGVGGSTVDTGTYFAWQIGDLKKRVQFTVAGSYWNREGLENQGDLQTLTSTAAFQWFFAPRYSLGVVHRYVNQDTANPTVTNGTNYQSYGLTFAWYSDPDARTGFRRGR